jgi:mannosyl-oligosaccharide alpha-1,2-mannosidase
MIRLGLLAIVAAVASAIPSNTPQDLAFGNSVKRQYYEPPPADSDARAQAVVDAFRTSWEGYYQYAFPMDELRPVNNSGSSSRYVNGLHHLL